ncbi:MAG: histidine kinase [Microbacteriaceae bacterium]|nr:histidine kinase [Microbacteriaceae bacterium]MCL2795655.1 histidine kinase [Microbacteriaceae bacterium]
MRLRDLRLLPLALNAIGIAVVAYASFTTHYGLQRGWWGVATVLALLAWALVVGLSRWSLDTTSSTALRRVSRVASAVGVVAAALSQAPSDGIHIAPLAILLIMAISDETESVWFGAALAAVAFVLTPIGAAFAATGAQAVLGYLAATGVWVLIGISRRQARTAQRRTAELLAQQQEAREQEAKAGLLAARQAAARDIHDVLAHSLGGLVIQLDAAEALLESGRVEDAASTVTRARALAAEGLADARRAVAALRSPDETEVSERTARDLAGAAERLLRAHRELGGRVAARLDLAGLPAQLPAPVATAFERALQEALSNARRHAPGAPVAVRLTASPRRLDLEVENPLAAAAGTGSAGAVPPREGAARVGGGHGLTGMAERFAALPGGSVTARATPGGFVVSATASLAED